MNNCPRLHHGASFGAWLTGMDSIELIRNFLHERMDVDPAKIGKDTVLAELGVDSLMGAELLFEAEDRMDIEISSDEPAPVTVADLQAIIERSRLAKHASAR